MSGSPVYTLSLWCLQTSTPKTTRHRCFMHTWPSVDNAYCINLSCFINLIRLSLVHVWGHLPHIFRSHFRETTVSFLITTLLNLFCFFFLLAISYSSMLTTTDKTIPKYIFHVCDAKICSRSIILNNEFFPPPQLMQSQQTASFCLHPLCD